jgi:hypothetical protein
MKTQLALLLLALSAPSAALTAPSEPDNPVARIKSAIDRDWVAKPGDFGSVVVASPSYAMPFNQGCVIHQLAFLSVNGKASLGEMVSTDQYFVFAAGDACATVDPALFFSIEPGNDKMALLDFSKRLKSGPRPGKDKMSDADYARISPCFTTEAMPSTRIVRAHSWRRNGAGQHDTYQTTLRCKAQEQNGEIVAFGFRGLEAVTWRFKPWGETTVDVPVANPAAK